MTTKTIQVGDLDFDAIRQNLKTFLQSQSQFKDYNFEGAGLSVLLDVLAYNTHYKALYDNMAINEMFLDSAIKRNSVVSRAKELSYTPRSATCPRAVVAIEVKSTDMTSQMVVMPPSAAFQSSSQGAQFNFYSDQSYTAAVSPTSPGVFNFPSVTLIGGQKLNYRFTVSDGATYVLPNQYVDVSTIKVRVQNNPTTATFQTYNLTDTLLSVGALDTVYWAKEIDGGFIEITFGDGIIGTALLNGAVISVDYMVSPLDVINGANTFTYSDIQLATGAVMTVTCLTPAAGGDLPESIDSIKFTAPRMYAAQQRAVTAEDYKAILYANVPGIASIAVWGGEDNNPPVYGKMYICIKPTSAPKLTAQQKSDILTGVLGNKNVMTVVPEIVDPDELSIQLTVTVYYNQNDTTLQPNDIESLVTNTIFNYDSTQLQKFDGIFRYSKLSKLIDSTDASILNNAMTLVIKRLLQPQFNLSANYVVDIINPIYATGMPMAMIQSTGFVIQQDQSQIYYLDDDGMGNIRLYYLNATSQRVVTNPQIGTVDYLAGKISISGLNIVGIVGSVLELSIVPSSNDVVSAYTQIAAIDRVSLSVTAVPDQTANGDTRAGTAYIHAANVANSAGAANLNNTINTQSNTVTTAATMPAMTMGK